MLTIFILTPWVLTVITLLAIIMLKQRNSNDYIEEEDEDFPFDNDHEVVRVAVYGDTAYWVYDNVFYESEVIREPDFSTAKAIDTMDLPPKELYRLMTILDELENERDL